MVIVIDGPPINFVTFLFKYGTF